MGAIRGGRRARKGKIIKWSRKSSVPICLDTGMGILCTLKSMGKQEKSVHKKSRGRPAGRRYGETIPVRLTPDMIEKIDLWAKRRDFSRSEAIRKLIELAIANK
jgi:hypothetical protein